MKLNKLIFASLLAGGVLLTTSCRDDWADLNQDPSNVTQTTPEYLLTQAILKFEPSGYTYWFYNAKDFFTLDQFGVPTGSVLETYNTISPGTGLMSTVLRTYANEIDATLAKMSDEDKKSYEWVSAAADVLSIYLGIYDTDFAGDIPYTEAGKARQDGTLTPKMDKVKDLYDLWLTNLEKDMTTFTNSKTSPTAANQDMVFQGDLSKWAKLANSLRLKIAVRYLGQDAEKAKSIAQQVATASTGYMDEDNASDPTKGQSMIFNKATYNSSSDDYTYHWNNGVLTEVAAGENLMNFMVDNRDPRVRFVFTKNNWNAQVVQGFLDAGKYKQIPTFVLENCEISADHKTFLGWKQTKDGEAWGEPWVRYYGLPGVWNAANIGEYNQWFKYSNEGYSYLDANYQYRPYSTFQTEMIMGRVTTNIPTLPGETIIQDKDQHPWYGLYMTAAETNLYLAEFAVLGVSLPHDADYYYNRALQMSVTEYNLVAAMNKIPYYGTTYGLDKYTEAAKNEKVIDLKEGEIEAMMKHDQYQLTGSTGDKLEKIYLQEMIHFFLNPIDQFVTARRSGCPKFDSKLMPRIDYAAHGIGADAIPRRVAINALSPSDKMYQIYEQSYKEQGYTIGTTDMKLLNSERVWQDKNAPQWGAGPKY